MLSNLSFQIILTILFGLKKNSLAKLIIIRNYAKCPRFLQARMQKKEFIKLYSALWTYDRNIIKIPFADLITFRSV